MELPRCDADKTLEMTRSVHFEFRGSDWAGIADPPPRLASRVAAVIMMGVKRTEGNKALHVVDAAR
jgi:hypothetical protein